MASLLAKYISKKFLAESLENKFGTEDPYFESVPATRLDGTPSKKRTKRVRKALPPGLSDHDSKVLTKVKRRAYRLDMSLFTLCGIKFGWGSVIGFIPAIGDILDAFMAMMVFRTCQSVEGGLPVDVKTKMMFNIIIDFVIGLVPFIGDVADAAFKANTKNAAELEKHLRKKGEQNLKAAGRPVPTVDPSDPDEYDRMMASNESPPEYVDQAPPRQGQMRTEPLRNGEQMPLGQQSGTTAQQAGTTTTTQATTTTTSNNRGFFSKLFSKNERRPDLESGGVAPPAQQTQAGGARRVDQPLPNLPQQPQAAATNNSRLQKTRPT